MPLIDEKAVEVDCTGFLIGTIIMLILSAFYWGYGWGKGYL